MTVSPVDDIYEKELHKSGYDYIIGVDEVGRGSWAGPVVVGAFVYSRKTVIIPEVNDSKKLSLKKRQVINGLLKSEKYAIAEAGVDEIDELNILEATKLAMERAVASFSYKNAMVLIDGYFRDPFKINYDYKCVSKGDEKHYSIAAASILAKVFRDDLMLELSREYEKYGFKTNVGYGTKKHREALEKYGICDIHRRSYKPIKKILNSKFFSS